MGKLTEKMQKEIDSLSYTYKEEIFINGSHEYDYKKQILTDDVNVHTLYYSDHSDWGEETKKTIAVQLIDRGNGIEIMGLSTKKQLTYTEAEQLHILLRLASPHSVYQIAEPTPKKDF